MLIGRGAERARLDGLLEAARDGQSGVLVIRGEPGIGKTTLLRYAEERAEGFRVLRAVGVDAETELAFSGLHELVLPVLHLVESLPQRQARAIRTALALGPAREVDRFAVYAATLNLLAAAADNVPLLCLVDDAHWLDAASADAVVFACRRLAAEGIVVLFGAREGEARSFEAAGLPQLWLAGLHAEAAQALLDHRAPAPLSPEAARRLIELSAGNPLALLELGSLLGEHGHLLPLPSEAPPPVGSLLTDAFLRRASRLSDAGRAALEVAAAGATADAAEIGRATKALGLPPDALSEAEDEGLISVDEGTVRFRHPLVRSAVYHAAPLARRRAAHRALAEANTGPPERRAWHLAAAATGPDEETAAALEEAASSARRRGGMAAEAMALTWAARLTPEPRDRARRLVAAARATRAAGRAHDAEEILDEALGISEDEELWAEMQSVRADILYWKGDRREAARFATAAAERLGSRHPAQASGLLVVAAMAQAPEELREGLALADRALTLAERAGGPVLDIASVKANLLFRLGQTDEAARLTSRITKDAPPRADWEALAEAALLLAQLERYDEARAVIGQAVSELTAAGALKDLAHALCAQAQIETRAGNLANALAAGSASLRLADEIGEPLEVAFSASFLAVCEALLGREEDARRHAVQAIEATHGSEAVRTTLEARTALGVLELQLGNYGEAIGQLERVARAMTDAGVADPGYVQWTPELVEAYARSGRVSEAESLLRTLERQAASTDRVWAAAAAARCRGLMAAAEEVDRLFAEALDLHGQRPRPLEEARTRLCYGERLRRLGRRRDARDQLRAALTTFERLGARLWEARARDELAASGETIRKGDFAAREELTPQELHVALVVADGATNSEAAAQLFLSPKTIEFHLRNAYRKLGVRSRTQLARVLPARTEEPPGAQN